jgi:NitT/TauT family transport system ATP-binding protein
MSGSAAQDVRCAGVAKTWAAQTSRAHEALRDVDLEVEAREFVVLIGPSGCGKSTLLTVIAGLEAPTAGEVLCGGETDRSFVFQEAALFPWATVADNVAFGLRLQGQGKAERRGRAQELLKRVGLQEAAKKRPAELSGGMRQRAALARAMAVEPDVLLMDEPFAALDVQTRARMQQYLLETWRATEATTLFVTHHIDEAIALADRIVVMTARPGRIKATVPVELERPRDPRDPAHHELQDDLVDLLRDEVDQAFAQQEQGAS